MAKWIIIKWALRLAIWFWVGFWVAQIFIGDLGASPALKLNHKLGHITLVLLTANIGFGILLSVLGSRAGWLRNLFSERRFWGVSAFLVLLIHVFFYFVNEGFEPKAFTQIYTKTYLIFATLAFLLMFTLAVTSNNFSVRKLGGRRWKVLHRLVYAIQFLLFGHILLIEKADLELYAPWLIALAVAQAVRWLLVIKQRWRAA
jgi:methionine sulfoxide reductase heme-binding subunit